jgi:outer membrane protein
MLGGNMKKLFMLMVGIFIILCFQYTALGASPSKIAVVDIQKLQSQSKAFQKARSKLKTKFDAMQQKLKDEEEAIRKLEEDFNKQSMMLSLDAKQDKKRELDRKRRHYKYLYEDFTQEMKQAEQDETGKVGKDLEKILEKMAQKQGFAIILERRTIGLIYYADAIDITDQVTEAYDKMRQ